MNFKTILITFGVLVALITLLNNELSEDPFGLVLSKTTISPIRKMMNTKENIIPTIFCMLISVEISQGVEASCRAA